jgi:uroporphyrinogen decarboxylase
MTIQPPPALDLPGMTACLSRSGTPARVFSFEHSVADSMKAALLKRFALGAPAPASDVERTGRNEIALQRFLGQELLRLRLTGGRVVHAMPRRGGQWENEHAGCIQSMADVDRFPWPTVEGVDFRQLDWFERHLPDNLGVICTVHVWEDIRALFGYETFCYKLYEEPELVEAVARKVGAFNLALARALGSYTRVYAVYGADDFGYKAGLMVPPADLRRLVLCWHRAIAEQAHADGKLYLLHACGNLAEIMDELIDEVKIDAKHSFEDVIMPVTEAKRLYGRRVSLLGGLDVDLVARAGEAAIRRKVREVLEACQPGGGYCLGLGNWVTDYIPIDSYLAVLDEGRRFAGG